MYTLLLNSKVISYELQSGQLDNKLYYRGFFFYQLKSFLADQIRKGYISRGSKEFEKILISGNHRIFLNIYWLLIDTIRNQANIFAVEWEKALGYAVNFNV